MLVLAVLFAIGAVLLNMLYTDNRVISNYSNNMRAEYIAEAGADLVVKEWYEYVHTIPFNNVPPGDVGRLQNAKVNDFKLKLSDPVSFGTLATNIKNKYYNVKNIDISIDPNSWAIDSVTNNGDLVLNASYNDNDAAPTLHLIKLTVNSICDNAKSSYDVSLWYYLNGKIGSYIGSGNSPSTSTTVDADTPPIIKPSLTTFSGGVVIFTFCANDLSSISPININSLIILKDSSGNTVQLSGDSVSITSALNNNILSINCGTLASGSITLKTGAVTDTLFNKFTVSSDYVYKFP